MQTVIQRAIPRLSPRTRAKVARARIAAGVQAAKKLFTPEGAYKAGKVAGTVLRYAGPVAAGVVAYKLVSSRLRASMVNKQAIKQRAIEAAVVAARIDAEQQLGRKLRPSELANLNLQVEESLGGLP